MTCITLLQYFVYWLWLVFYDLSYRRTERTQTVGEMTKTERG